MTNKSRRFAVSKRVADVLVETLQAAGVKRCYGIVGDTLNRITSAIHESEIEWVHMRHEEAGAFAAGAHTPSPWRAIRPPVRHCTRAALPTSYPHRYKTH